MNPNILNTRAAQGLPLSAKNRRRKKPWRCSLGFHKWRRINDISPKRRCSCCGRIEWEAVRSFNQRKK